MSISNIYINQGADFSTTMIINTSGVHLGMSIKTSINMGSL